MATFQPSADTGDVRSDVFAGSTAQSFRDIEGATYEWVAELKDLYALELQSKLATLGGRVASDKFEWLRGRN